MSWRSRTARASSTACAGRVVIDRVYTKGKLTERTRDYYFESRSGNVSYYGEDTAEFDAHGNVTSREGTLHSGIDGARPGLFHAALPARRRAALPGVLPRPRRRPVSA